MEILARWLGGTAACRSIKKEDEIPWNLGRITRDAVFLLVAGLFEVSLPCIFTSFCSQHRHSLFLSKSQADSQSRNSQVIKRSIIA